MTRFRPRPAGAREDLALVALGIAALAALVALAVLASPARADEARPVDPRRVREAIESLWLESAPAGATLEVRRLPALRVRGRDLQLEVELPEDPMRPGPRALPVGVRVDGRTVARGLASVVVHVEFPVWTVVRPLRRGDVLDPTALAEGAVSFDREPVRLWSPEPGRTWRVVRDVPVGARLNAVHVRPIPDVEAGTEIRLVARAGRAHVAVTGRVRRDGDIGDTVPVLNPVTGALVQAVLVDRTTAVLVDAGADARREGRRGS